MGTNFYRLLTCGLFILLLPGCYKFTYQSVPGTYPVADMKVTRCNGKLYEVTVHVQPGVRLDSLVESSYFDGLHHRMSVEMAKRQLGEPRSVRPQPDMGGLPMHLYPVTNGTVGFIAVPTSGGSPRQPQVWAFPTNQAPEAVILDASLRAQLLPHLTTNETIDVYIFGDVGSGNISLSMSRDRVAHLVLGERDGDTQ